MSEGDILFKERGPSSRRGVLAWLLDPHGWEGELKLEARVAAEAWPRNPTASSRTQTTRFYIVLEGRGVLDVEGQQVELREGHAVFVRAGTEHRFGAYEQLSVLVIFERRAGETGAGSA